MHTRSVSQLGGFGALAVPTFTGLFFLMLVLATGLSTDPGWVAWPHVLSDYALALIGLSGLAAVPAITARVAASDRELARWAATIAQIGFGLLTVMSLWQAEYETTLAADALSLPGLAPDLPMDPRTSFLENALARLPQGWLEVAGVGFWILCVSLLGRRREVFPSALVWLGTVTGIVGIATSLAAALQITVAAGALQVIFCALLCPSWFLWMGNLMLDDVPVEAPTESPTPAMPATPRRKRYTLVPTLRRWADRMPSLN